MKRSDLRLRYIATGCGHCGTGYVARLLTSAGVACGHEHVFSHDTHRRITERLDEEVPLGPPPWGMSWDQIQAESSWPALFHLTHPCVTDATIIHIVRNPLLVIRSWLLYGGNKKEGKSLLFFIEQFLVRNLFIEHACRSRLGIFVFYPVESRQQLLTELGIERHDAIEDNPTYNQHIKGNEPTITWDDVELACKGRQRIFDQFVGMSIRYGYGGPQ